MMMHQEEVELSDGWKLHIQTLVWKFGKREPQGVTVYRYGLFCTHANTLAGAITFVQKSGFDPRRH